MDIVTELQRVLDMEAEAINRCARSLNTQATPRSEARENAPATIAPPPPKKPER